MKNDNCKRKISTQIACPEFVGNTDLTDYHRF